MKSNLNFSVGDSESELKVADCNYNCKSALAKKSIYGHSGYLTFAYLTPQE